jgi:hypothetical protein
LFHNFNRILIKAGKPGDEEAGREIQKTDDGRQKVGQATVPAGG